MGAKIDRAPSTTVVLSWLRGAGTSQEVLSLIWRLCEAPATFSLHFLVPGKLKRLSVSCLILNILQIWALYLSETPK